MNENFLNVTMGINQKPITNIRRNGKMLNSFPGSLRIITTLFSDILAMRKKKTLKLEEKRSKMT